MIVDNSQEAVKREQDISIMIKTVSESDLLPIDINEDRGLVNTFVGQKATPEQQHDLLNYREVGQQATHVYIQHNIIGRSSSISSTIRKKKLLTMSTLTKKHKKKSAKDRENERMIKCLQRRLAWCHHTGQQYNVGNEQYSVYPRALSYENGIPHKSSKSCWTDEQLNQLTRRNKKNW